jgi:hypothetical protein
LFQNRRFHGVFEPIRAIRGLFFLVFRINNGMETSMPLIDAHPWGESKNAGAPPSGSWPLDTPGGRFHAEWDDESPVTREGQLIFFFQFLHAGGRWEEFLKNCPLLYTGNRGSGALNVMGTIMLSVLCGHWRYAHINGVRGDGVNPGLLGMDKTVSEDVVRLAMARIDERAGLDWLCGQIVGSIAPALSLPWILDIISAVTLISNEIQHIMSIAEKWTIEQRWTLLLTRLLKRWLGGKWLDGLPEGAGILLSG